MMAKLRKLTDEEIVAGDPLPDALPDVFEGFHFYADVPTVIQITLTPDIAKEFLKRNFGNRPVDEVKVKEFTSGILAGEFLIGAGQMAFDVNGRLMDGQKRCMAVIRAGKAIDVFVATGLPPETQFVMDTGQRRSAANALVISGMATKETATTLDRVCRIAIAREGGFHSLVRGNVNGLDPVRNPEVMAYLDANPDIYEAVRFTKGLRTRTPPRLQFIPPAPLAYAYLVLARIHHDDADQFFRDLAARKSTGALDPITAIYDTYETYQTAKITMRVSTHLFILFHAWNARRDGRDLRQLRPEPTMRNGQRVTKIVPLPR